MTTMSFPDYAIVDIVNAYRGLQSRVARQISLERKTEGGVTPILAEKKKRVDRNSALAARLLSHGDDDGERRKLIQEFMRDS